MVAHANATFVGLRTFSPNVGIHVQRHQRQNFNVVVVGVFVRFVAGLHATQPMEPRIWFCGPEKIRHVQFSKHANCRWRRVLIRICAKNVTATAVGFSRRRPHIGTIATFAAVRDGGGRRRHRRTTRSTNGVTENFLKKVDQKFGGV